MIKMTHFSDWLFDKFSEWEKTSGKRRRSVAEFSRYLGVKQPTLARWIIGDSIPKGDSVNLLADKLGPEVYDQLGLPRPVFYSLPEDFRNRLNLAIREVNENLSTFNLGKDIKESTRITIEIFERHGFKYTGKDKEVTGSKK